VTVIHAYSRNVLCLLVLVFFLLSPARGIAQEDSTKGEEGSSSSKPAYVTMNFKDVDLQVFIKFISELSGKNFLIDPNVRGTVTIISPQKVTVDEVYQVFLSVLEVNGFTTVEAGQVIKIIPTAAAKTKATDTVLQRHSVRGRTRSLPSSCPSSTQMPHFSGNCSRPWWKEQAFSSLTRKPTPSS
jgi:type II secretory pathway component GspD/PulD (secretin)